MNEQDYREANGYSQSDLKVLSSTCPKAFKYYWDNPDLRKKPRNQRNLDLGTAVHMYILQPEKARTEIVVCELMHANTAGYRKLKELNKNKIVLTAPEHSIALGCSDEVKATKFWQELLISGEVICELPLFWSDPVAPNVPLKSRIDLISDKYVIDIKTTASLEGFEKDFYNFKYYFQAAAYLRAVKEKLGGDRKFVIIAVEKDPPNIVQIFQVHDRVIEYGDVEWKRTLRLLNHCIESEDWYDYSQQEDSVIYLPKWREDQLKALE